MVLSPALRVVVWWCSARRARAHQRLPLRRSGERKQRTNKQRPTGQPASQYVRMSPKPKLKTSALAAAPAAPEPTPSQRTASSSSRGARPSSPASTRKAKGEAATSSAKKASSQSAAKIMDQAGVVDLLRASAPKPSPSSPAASPHASGNPITRERAEAAGISRAELAPIREEGDRQASGTRRGEEEDDALLDVTDEMSLPPAGATASTVAVLRSDPKRCVIEGLLSNDSYYMRDFTQPGAGATFTVLAYNSRGERLTNGGESVLAAVRGASRVRARVTDLGDGSYAVKWRPEVSGTYTIAVSVGGAPLAGSPITVHVHDSTPFAACCELRGAALHEITSRVAASFDVCFRDRGNRKTQAVDLDVFVVAQPSEEEMARAAVEGAYLDCPEQPLAFDVATKPKVVAATPGSFARKGKEREDEDAIADRWWEQKKEQPTRRKKKAPNSTVIADANKVGMLQGRPSTTEASAVAAVGAGVSAGGDTGKRFARDDVGGGYTSPDELLTLADRVRMRRRAIPVQVTNSRPLLVRASYSLKSRQLGYLPPGAMATVIEERIDASGDVRACVMLEAPVLWADEAGGGADIQASASIANHPAAGGGDAGGGATGADLVPLSARQAVEAVPSSVEASAPAAPAAPVPVPGAVSESMDRLAAAATPSATPPSAVSFAETPSAATGDPVDGRGCDWSGLDSMGGGQLAHRGSRPGRVASRGGRVPKLTELIEGGGAAQVHSSSNRFLLSRSSAVTLAGASPLTGRTRLASPPRSPIPRPHSPTHGSVLAPPEPLGSSAAALIAHAAETRTSSPRAPPYPSSSSSSPERHGGGGGGGGQQAGDGGAELGRPTWLTGWVTLRKEGRKLVSSRVRVEPWVRQRAALLWKAQQVTDKLHLGLEREIAMLDPTGVGFAFGGVTPGVILAKGHVHDWHKVHFTIGRAGRYLLHVRLRDAKQPLPGSPFALTVVPGEAHATRVILLPESRPLKGEVGMEEFAEADKKLLNVAAEKFKVEENSKPVGGYGCSLLIKTADRSGNPCIAGGAKVQVTCARDSVNATVKDNGDGTYLLTWLSKISTMGITTTRVDVNGYQVRGSPMQLQLVSTRPERTKTEVRSAGSVHLTPLSNSGHAHVSTAASTSSALEERVRELRRLEPDDTESDPFGGVGLRHAVAGEPTSIFLRFRDENGNFATPPEQYCIKMALGNARATSDGGAPSAADKPATNNQGGRKSEGKKKALDEYEEYEDVVGERGPEDSGCHTLTYVARAAGTTDLVVWSEPMGSAGVREQLPGSPFTLHVTANVAVAQRSFVDGFQVESKKEKDKAGGAGGGGGKGSKGGSSKPLGGGCSGESEGGGNNTRRVFAGDVAILRLYGVDAYGNPALPPDPVHVDEAPAASAAATAKAAKPDNPGDQFLVPALVMKAAAAGRHDDANAPGAANASQGAFRAKATIPASTSDEAPMESELVVALQAKAGRAATYDIRHECIVSGEHAVHVALNGAPVVGSPVMFSVWPSNPTPHHSKLVPPENIDAIIADMEHPVTILLRTYDKFGNPCDTGGLRAAGRLTLIKQSMNDITILSPSNHSVVVDDLQDGSYAVRVAMMMAATVRLTVNMDKDMQGTTGELPPLQLTFVDSAQPGAVDHAPSPV